MLATGTALRERILTATEAGQSAAQIARDLEADQVPTARVVGFFRPSRSTFVTASSIDSSRTISTLVADRTRFVSSPMLLVSSFTVAGFAGAASFVLSIPLMGVR